MSRPATAKAAASSSAGRSTPKDKAQGAKEGIAQPFAAHLVASTAAMDVVTASGAKQYAPRHPDATLLAPPSAVAALVSAQASLISSAPSPPSASPLTLGMEIAGDRKVKAVIPALPAHTVGVLHAGDEILSVDGDTGSKPGGRTILDLLRGDQGGEAAAGAGSPCRIIAKRGGGEVRCTLRRTRASLAFGARKSLELVGAQEEAAKRRGGGAPMADLARLRSAILEAEQARQATEATIWDTKSAVLTALSDLVTSTDSTVTALSDLVTSADSTVDTKSAVLTALSDLVTSTDSTVSAADAAGGSAIRVCDHAGSDGGGSADVSGSAREAEIGARQQLWEARSHIQGVLGDVSEIQDLVVELATENTSLRRRLKDLGASVSPAKTPVRRN